MICVRRIVLDVLKPHQPNALEFAQTLAAVGLDYKVRVIVMEVDENTETLQLEIEGDSLNFDGIQTAIKEIGGSLHSIDQVEVINLGGEGELGE